MRFLLVKSLNAIKSSSAAISSQKIHDPSESSPLQFVQTSPNACGGTVDDAENNISSTLLWSMHTCKITEME